MYKFSETRTDFVEFILKNQFEYPVLNMLLFNDLGFSFYIMQKPEIRNLENEFCIADNGKNVLESQEQFPTFINIDGLSTFVYHPEHLYGYCARYGEKSFGEIVYNRKKDSADILLSELLSDFCDAVGFDSFEQVQTYMRKCLIRQRKNEKADKGNLDYEFDALDFIFNLRSA